MNKTESGLSTSAVDIEIKEYNQNNEPFQDDGKVVMPGDEIILIPRVNNLGIECYLRAKITYTIRDESFNVEDYINGNYSSWTKSGEYYYYDGVFDKEASVDLFNKVTIPNLSNDYYGSIIVVHIVVEAIQAKNFDGNWEGIEIKESVDRTYDIDYDGESSVIYEDNVHKHITLDDHFFDNLGNLLPGDSISEEITILNSSYDKNEYFVAIDYDNLSDEEKALLRSIKLKIRNSNGEELVSSNLEDKTRHSLGIYRKGGGDRLTIELSLPTDIDNDYSKLFTKIMWRFSYDVISHGNLPPNPNTWDLKFDLSIALFIASAIGFLVVLFAWKINNDDIEKNN
ncbi:MAG: hypothetical protein IKQ06_02690 [Bacilli bacterium]|nr:hypothetical protein [Bacilli bacterium]